MVSVTGLRRWSLLFVLCGCFAGVVPLSAQEAAPQTGQPRSAIVVNQDVDLKFSATTASPDFYGIVDLGAIDANSEMILNLTLNNRSESTIRFDTAKPGCTCTEFQVDGNSISSNQAVKALVKFKVTDGRESNRHVANVLFFSDGIRCGALSVTCEIRNRLSFGNAVRNVVNLSDKLIEYRIPVYFSPPVELKNLVAEVPKSELSGLEIDCKLVALEAGICILHLTTSGADVKESFLQEKVVVKDVISGKSIQTDILFTKRGPVEFSPAELFFVKSSEQPEIYEASALIRLRAVAEVQEQVSEKQKQADAEGEPSGDVNRDSEKSERIKVTALTPAGRKLSIESRAIGKKIARVKVRLGADELKGLEEIVWMIQFGNQRYEWKSKISK